MFRPRNVRIATGPLRSVPWNQSYTAGNIVVYALLLGLGALQLYMSRRADDFYSGDVTYFELARSMIEKSLYGFDFRAETTLPPGLPVILVGLCITVGCHYAVLVRSMAVFATLGFVVSYELLRREGERAFAAISCLLLASSPMFFAFATRMVFSDLPYFFTSIATLLVAIRLDNARTFLARAGFWLLAGLLLVGSLLIRSSGIALLTGFSAWLIVSLFADRKAASRRLKTFIPLLVLGVVVQASWMRWAAEHEALQWPMVQGYPQSYISQLKVKNGNYPELGTASLGDIPLRIARNLNDRAVAVTQLLTRKDYVNPGWFSPPVVGCVLLILLGLVGSLWRGGGSLPEWYFISHETIYLVWPWNFEIRFLLPVLPLACLYLWRGCKIIMGLASEKPHVVGASGLALSIFMALYSGTVALDSKNLQPELAAIFWVMVSIVCVWMALTRFDKSFEALAFFLAKMIVTGKSWAMARIAGIATIIALVVVGFIQQLALGRENLDFDMTRQPGYSDLLAGKWVAANTASSAVVMARSLDLVYHYSRRKILWFPPSSDPELLMEGIRKYKVDFVIISERRYSYWLPPESVCFESLSRAYPRDFQLVHDEPRFRIFKLVPKHSEVKPVSGKSS